MGKIKERHPKAFEDAKAYEKTAIDSGSPFTWTRGESLSDLENLNGWRKFIKIMS